MGATSPMAQDPAHTSKTNATAPIAPINKTLLYVNPTVSSDPAPHTHKLIEYYLQRATNTL